MIDCLQHCRTWHFFCSTFSRHILNPRTHSYRNWTPSSSFLAKCPFKKTLDTGWPSQPFLGYSYNDENQYTRRITWWLRFVKTTEAIVLMILLTITRQISRSRVYPLHLFRWFLPGCENLIFLMKTNLLRFGVLLNVTTIFSLNIILNAVTQYRSYSYKKQNIKWKFTVNSKKPAWWVI